MKVLHISLDHYAGGASIAAYRLHKELRNLNIDSDFFCKNKQSETPHILKAKYHIQKKNQFRSKLDQIKFSLKYNILKRANNDWSNPYLVYGNEVLDRFLDPGFDGYDLIHFHWVSTFIDLKSFFSKFKSHQGFVWTLHDTFPITGGCHHFRNCNKYQIACGSCPQINSSDNNDITQSSLQEKQNI